MSCERGYIRRDPKDIVEKMTSCASPPRDRVREWMGSAEAEGESTMDPEEAFPGLVLGFLIRGGT